MVHQDRKKKACFRASDGSSDDIEEDCQQRRRVRQRCESNISPILPQQPTSDSTNNDQEGVVMEETRMLLRQESSTGWIDCNSWDEEIQQLPSRRGGGGEGSSPLHNDFRWEEGVENPLQLQHDFGDDGDNNNTDNDARLSIGAASSSCEHPYERVMIHSRVDNPMDVTTTFGNTGEENNNALPGQYNNDDIPGTVTILRNGGTQRGNNILSSFDCGTHNTLQRSCSKSLLQVKNHHPNNNKGIISSSKQPLNGETLTMRPPLPISPAIRAMDIMLDGTDLSRLHGATKPVMLTLTSFPFRILHATEAYTTMTGRRISNIIGITFYELFVTEGKRHALVCTNPTPLGNFDRNVVRLQSIRDDDRYDKFCMMQIQPVYYRHHHHPSNNNSSRTQPSLNGLDLKYYAVFLEEIQFSLGQSRPLLYLSMPSGSMRNPMCPV